MGRSEPDKRCEHRIAENLRARVGELVLFWRAYRSGSVRARRDSNSSPPDS
jgi:hypothetical protein